MLQNVISSKENPIKPSVFGQSTGNNQQNITPSGNPNAPNSVVGGGAAPNQVRRSSRLFLTQSVKENNSAKAPTKKARGAPKSPSRNKTNKQGRTALAAKELAEKNEKNSAESGGVGGGSGGVAGGSRNENKDAIIAGSDDDLVKPHSQDNSASKPTPPAVNPAAMRAQALEIQKQSVEGLLGLMRQLGAGYVELSKYNSESACEILDSVAPHQRNTGWVRGLLGKAKFEVAQYKDAKE